jgi:MscS family membrane protein
MKYTLLSVLLIFTTHPIFSQINLASNEASLQSPHHTLFTHLHFLQEETLNKELSAQTIYAPEFSLEEKVEAAEKLKKILDGKGIYVDINLVSKEENYTDTVLQQNVYFISKLDKRLYLEKIDTSWYYSASTVNLIDEMFKEVYPWGAEFLSSFFVNSIGNKKVVFGLRVWQVTGILFIIFLALISYWLLKHFTKFFINTFFKIDFIATNVQIDLVLAISKAFSLLVTFFWISRFLPALLLPPHTAFYVIKATQIFTVFFAGIFAVRVIALIMNHFSKLAKKTETKLDEQLVPIVDKLLRIVVATIVIVFSLKILDVDLVAILAGLSVGALALALAAQDTVKNFIGSITIFLDKPFEIGDFIEVAGVKGTVEEVGIRATRLRTPNQSLAYIPNGNLANMTVDNLGLRKYRRWQFDMGIEYGTPTNKIEQFTRECREILNEYPYALSDSNQVRLNSLGDFSVNIYVNVMLDIRTHAEELRCKHELLILFIKKAEEVGVSFAFPTQTLHIEKPQ